MPGRFKTGIVTLALGSQSINRLKRYRVPIDGKSVVIRKSCVLGAAGVFSFVKVLMVARTIVNMAGTLEGATKLLPGATVFPTDSIPVHGQPSFTNWVANRQLFGAFGISLIQRNEALAGISVFDCIVDILGVIRFVRKETAFTDRKKFVGSA